MTTGTITPLRHPSDPSSAPATDWQQLEQGWRALESQADGSFFISWSWIGSWLETLPQGTPLYLFRCEQDGELIGLAILTRYQTRKRRLFTSNSIGLNQIAASGLNMNIEYNGVLCRQQHEPQVLQALLSSLHHSGLDWTELVASAISEHSWRLLQTAGNDYYWLKDERFMPWARNIHGVASTDDILSTLSRNRRWQIRRSIRHYEQDAGRLDCQSAQSLKQALEWFEQMGELHTQRWNRDGLAGSFANRRWVDFHRQLIARAFDRNEIQLLKITAGDSLLGVIYSFLWRGRVYMLQTGFAASEDNVQRPGYIGHCLAMVENARLGMKIYDFMCGDADYKAALGTAQPALYWVRGRRKRVANRLEDFALNSYRAVKALASRTS